MDTMQLERVAAQRATGAPFRFRQIEAAGPDALRDQAIAAARAGFDALLLPCPYATINDLPADLGQASAPYGAGPIASALALIAQLRDETGLAMVVDLPVAVVAVDSPLHRSAPDHFVPLDTRGLFDPRLPLELDRVHVRFDNDAEIDRHASILGVLINALRAGGVAGIRIRNLPRIPAPVINRVFTAVRAATQGVLLIADTPGIAWAALDTLAPGLFDYTIASAAWWNRRDPWFYAELDHLRRIAPPLIPAAVADPNDAARPDTRLARDLGLAATLGAGWILPAAQDLASAETTIAETNALFAAAPAATCMAGSGLQPLAGLNGPVLATLRTATVDARAADRAFLALLNMDATRPATIDPASLLPATGGMFGPFAPIAAATGPATPLRPGRPLTLAPGEFRLFTAAAQSFPQPAPLTGADATQAADTLPRLAIEKITPAVDDGLFPVKRIAGEIVTVQADLICDGHDKLGAVLQWTSPEGDSWEETRLIPLGNDRWQASFPLTAVGPHRFRLAAWRDAFATFRDELAKKHAAGVPTALELREGTLLVTAILEASKDAAHTTMLERIKTLPDDARRDLFLSDETAALMAAADPRPFLIESAQYTVDAERTGAGFAAWYEIFPRSMSDDPARHGTFRDVERHLPRIKAMGFDVLYFPPVHPIGKTNRKGPNNTLTPSETDPGSPYAVGAPEGGHKDLHPELGSFEDFEHLRQAALEHGLELALDFAIQCSPDHPWLRDHPDWFIWRPDGTIRYAENPPKKYQDIVNVDFYADGSIPGLWLELADTVLFWCARGVRLFRVDNPHTKAFPFWQWMIGAVRTRYPDAVFLAEAFTRPKIMARLAKIGFSQSYTYFTWRNAKAEIEEYLTELSDGPGRDFYRPHFFVNTPDINPFFLQTSGRPGFLIRAALAATLSGLWGVYCGFELCEGTPLGPNKEEYLDSEKFQIRAWDWDRPGNIVPEITALNAIRRANRALQTHLGVTFLPAGNDAVLFYEKATPDRSNVVLVALSLDPANTQSAAIELPLWRSRLPDHATIELQDLIGGDRFTLTGKYQNVTLSPERPYTIWRMA